MVAYVNAYMYVRIYTSLYIYRLQGLFPAKHYLISVSDSKISKICTVVFLAYRAATPGDHSLICLGHLQMRRAGMYDFL
jgi:hypothetical protein